MSRQVAVHTSLVLHTLTVIALACVPMLDLGAPPIELEATWSEVPKESATAPLEEVVVFEASAPPPAKEVAKGLAASTPLPTAGDLAQAEMPFPSVNDLPKALLTRPSEAVPVQESAPGELPRRVAVLGNMVHDVAPRDVAAAFLRSNSVSECRRWLTPTAAKTVRIFEMASKKTDQSPFVVRQEDVQDDSSDVTLRWTENGQRVTARVLLKLLPDGWRVCGMGLTYGESGRERVYDFEVVDTSMSLVIRKHPKEEKSAP